MEEAFPKYPPKTTIERPFDLQVFREDCQQMGCKIRWEEERAARFNEEQKLCVLPDEVVKKYEDLDDEEKERLVLQEGRERQIYDRKGNVINLSKFKATDSRHNAHITLPAPLTADREALINIRLNRYEKIAEEYHDKETENGLTTPNLPEEALEGLESIQKRMKKKEIIMLQTDKSGKLVPTDYNSFERMGEEHTSKDKLISRMEANKIHREQDNHSSQLIKCFNMGGKNEHTKRIRESYLGGNGISPMNLMVKDHKPPDPKTGLPKTRPVVNGTRSNNAGPSEMISMILEKIQKHQGSLGRKCLCSQFRRLPEET